MWVNKKKFKSNIFFALFLVSNLFFIFITVFVTKYWADYKKLFWDMHEHFQACNRDKTGGRSGLWLHKYINLWVPLVGVQYMRVFVGGVGWYMLQLEGHVRMSLCFQKNPFCVATWFCAHFFPPDGVGDSHTIYTHPHTLPRKFKLSDRHRVKSGDVNDYRLVTGFD